MAAADDEIRAELDDMARTAVWAGADALDDVRAGLLEVFAPDGVTADEVDEVVTRQAEAHAEAALTFPTPTDPERLDALFAQLDEDGIVARQDVGFTQQDLVLEMRELLAERPEARGWVAFHRQDLEGVLAGDGQPLHLAYAHRDGGDADEDLGREVADRAKTACFDVVWDGDPDHRVELHGLRWERRR